jgi:hypothetical protein
MLIKKNELFLLSKTHIKNKKKQPFLFITCLIVYFYVLQIFKTQILTNENKLQQKSFKTVFMY